VTESFDQRLTGVESSMADFRDDTDEIRLSEITERIQEIAHTLETMSNKIEGLENQMRAARLLRLAIAATAGIVLLERLL
jgi:hypothetical protein